MNDSITCQCPCGSTQFLVAGAPLFRVLCHCTICQRFNNAALADVLVFRAADATLPPAGKVDFDTYRPPPNVQRGKCHECAAPAVENFSAPLMPKLVIVPHANFPQSAAAPAPAAHIFYDKRQADVNDELPKYNGYWASQWLFGKLLLPALMRR